MESLPHQPPWRIERALSHDARPHQGSLPAVFAQVSDDLGASASFGGVQRCAAVLVDGRQRVQAIHSQALKMLRRRMKFQR
jgi:hypothetical protein